MIRFLILSILIPLHLHASTIAIIDTGFDLDNNYLRPKILTNEDEEDTIDFQGWDFFDNSHLKKPVIEDKSSLQEILLFRSIRAKGHRQGLSLEEFDWFRKKNADKVFMEKVRLFKKHSHGTFVAGIALREGENINIFPIRGLNLQDLPYTLKGKTPEERFQEEINQSIDRVSKKFSKICAFIARKKIDIVNASYGITYKHIVTKFRERYKEMVGKEIEETKLKVLTDDYFTKLYQRGEKTILKYPNILFVFSAGNSGLDNDNFHHYPSRIRLPNTITVGAMNGDYLATFSNYGLKHVDIGAPGVAILSIVPKVYSDGGADLYSPASGTSMAAPYVSNLAAQILNTNKALSAFDIKKIILQTGDAKDYLKTRLASGAIVDNHKALKAALLTKDMGIDLAINLAKSDLIPMEDRISIGLPPAVSPEEVQKKMLESIPSVITPQEVDEEPLIDEAATTKPLTKLPSSSQKNPEKGPQDNSVPPASVPQDAPVKSADPVPSSQTEEQLPLPSAETPASSSPPQPSLPSSQSPTPSPSSPQ